VITRPVFDVRNAPHKCKSSILQNSLDLAVATAKSKEFDREEGFAIAAVSSL
jgi:hypothetical protein